MRPNTGWMYLALGLMVMLTGCAADSPAIPSAGTAAWAGSSGEGKISLAWDPVMAESFDLFMATAPGALKSGKKISNVANPIQITDLKVGGTYYFTVAARNNQKPTLTSPEIAHTVRGRDDRVDIALYNQTAAVTLAWDESEGAASYNIYWRNTPGVTRENGFRIPEAEPPYRIGGLIPGVTYFFVVTAVGKSGAESSASKEISYRPER